MTFWPAPIGGGEQRTNALKTADHTLVIGDVDKRIQLAAGGIVLTIPTNAAVAFPVGTSIPIVALSPQCELVADPGVNLITPASAGYGTPIVLSTDQVAWITQEITDVWTFAVSDAQLRSGRDATLPPLTDVPGGMLFGTPEGLWRSTADQTAWDLVAARLITDVWIPATSYRANIGGSPTILASATGAMALLTGGAACSYLLGRNSMPDHWVTFNVELWWAAEVGGTGDVDLQAQTVVYVSGSPLGAAAVLEGTFSVTDPPTDEVIVSTLNAPINCFAPGDTKLLVIERPADTYTQDVYLLGTRLVQAS